MTARILTASAAALAWFGSGVMTALSVCRKSGGEHPDLWDLIPKAAFFALLGTYDLIILVRGMSE